MFLQRCSLGDVDAAAAAARAAAAAPANAAYAVSNTSVKVQYAPPPRGRITIFGFLGLVAFLFV